MGIWWRFGNRGEARAVGEMGEAVVEIEYVVGEEQWEMERRHKYLRR